MPALQSHNFHGIAAALATLDRPADLDELALRSNRQRSIVIA
jgi:hypothetical protein